MRKNMIFAFGVKILFCFWRKNCFVFCVRIGYSKTKIQYFRTKLKDCTYYIDICIIDILLNFFQRILRHTAVYWT